MWRKLEHEHDVCVCAVWLRFISLNTVCVAGFFCTCTYYSIGLVSISCDSMCENWFKCVIWKRTRKKPPPKLNGTGNCSLNVMWVCLVLCFFLLSLSCISLLCTRWIRLDEVPIHKLLQETCLVRFFLCIWDSYLLHLISFETKTQFLEYLTFNWQFSDEEYKKNIHIHPLHIFYTCRFFFSRCSLRERSWKKIQQ